MTMLKLRTYDGVPNPHDKAPVWVRATITVGKTLTGTVKLDWNHRTAQAALEAYTNGVLRAGGSVEIKAIE